jgi:hypothetical protein
MTKDYLLHMRTYRELVTNAVEVSGGKDITSTVEDALGEYIMNHKDSMEVLLEKKTELEKALEEIKYEIKLEDDRLKSKDSGKIVVTKTEEEEKSDTVKAKIVKQLQIEKLDKLLVSKWVGVYSKYLGKDEDFVKDLMISTAKESFPREYSDYC